MLKFPDWFRKLWWALLLIGFTAVVIYRIDGFLAGTSSISDNLVLVIWILLWLAPVFTEVDLFGVKFKQEVDSMRTEFRDRFLDIRSEIQNSISVSPRFYLGLPPTSSELENLKEQFAELKEKQPVEEIADRSSEKLQLPQTVSEPFAARYYLENELRRIGLSREGIIWANRSSIIQIVIELERSQVIDKQLADAVAAVIRIANAAMHGADISDDQLQLVRSTTPFLLSTLSRIT